MDCSAGTKTPRNNAPFKRTGLGGVVILAFVFSLSMQSHAGPEDAPLSPALSISNAYQFLKNQMDLYHRELYVYKDENAGGNTFIPGGWIGDYGDIAVDDGCTNDPAEGSSCLRLDYLAGHAPSNGWEDPTSTYSTTRQ